MAESLGALAYELAAESLIASAVLWAAAVLAERLRLLRDSAWRSRLFLLPVIMPVPLVLVVHLLVRPWLSGVARTPLETLLASAVQGQPWVAPAFLGLTAVALLAWGVHLLRLLLTLHRQGRQWRRHQREQPAPWLRCNSTLRLVARRLGMTPARVTLVDGNSSGSIALGPLGSYVMVASNLASQLDDGELEGLLAHELAHVKRRDTLVDAIASLCRYLLCLNPFVVSAQRRYVRVREEAVDRLAVSATRDPLALASCLVKASRSPQEQPRSTVANCLFDPAGASDRRIRRLLDSPGTIPVASRWHPLAFSGVVAAVVAFTLLTL